MSLSDMKVFDKFVAEATIETLGQMVDKFNAASNGAFMLSTEGFTGDFLHETMWKGIHAAQRRVDRYAANAAVSATALEQIENTGVKIAGGFGPITFEPSQLSWMMKNDAEAIEMASRNLAEAMLSDQLNTLIAALVAAIGNQAALVNDVSGTGVLTYRALNGAHAKFGDRSANIVADVMTGAAYHALIDQNLSNAQTLFTAGGVTVTEILGKVNVITDAPALYVAAAGETPAKHRALGLVAGAGIVHNSGDVITNTEVSNGKTRIEATFQADYTFGLAIKGYAWDTENGGKSPTDAEIATGSNWDKTPSDDKFTAGVLAIGQA